MGSRRTEDVIVLRETVAESIVKDLMSVLILGAATSIGWLLGMVALQWLGGLAWLFFIAVRCARFVSDARMTPQAAADLLLANYGVSATNAAERLIAEYNLPTEGQDG